MTTNLKPRRLFGLRPTCEAVMPAMYFHRAYAARDAMSYDFKWGYDTHPVGHLDGGYCIDQPLPATGGHVAGDFVYRGA